MPKKLLQFATRGVYSARKSELFPSAKRRLPNPSPTSKLQVPPNQGHRSTLTFFLMILWGCHSAKCPHGTHRGVSEGEGGRSPAGKFCIFEAGIVQFGEYLWGASLEQAMSLQKSFMDLT